MLQGLTAKGGDALLSAVPELGMAQNRISFPRVRVIGLQLENLLNDHKITLCIMNESTSK